MANPNRETLRRALTVIGQAVPQRALIKLDPAAKPAAPPGDASRAAPTGRPRPELSAEAARRAAKLADVSKRTQADVDRYRLLVARAVAHRQPPSVAQLATATVVTAGAGLNLIGTVLSGGTWDPGLFDDGEPWAGEPVPAPLLQSASGGMGPRRLQDLAAIVAQAKHAETPSVAVTRIANNGRPARFVISAPGTQQPLGVVADRRPFDGTGNLRGMAGQTSATAAAIALAIMKAGVPRGAHILLNGHSQGGINFAALASDRAFTDHYTLDVLLAYGAPIEGFDFDPRVEVVALCNPTDWIQALDLKAVGLQHHPRTRGHFVEYWLPGPVRRATGPLADHGMAQYCDAIAREEGTGSELDRIIAETGIGRFLLLEGGTASTQLIPVGRRYPSR